MYRNYFHKTDAQSFNGAIIAQHYTLRAVLLNQCVNSCNSLASCCFTLVRQWVYCWHAEGETVNEMTRVSHVYWESQVMSDYLLHVSLSGMGECFCLRKCVKVKQSRSLMWVRVSEISEIETKGRGRDRRETKWYISHLMTLKILCVDVFTSWLCLAVTSRAEIEGNAADDSSVTISSRSTWLITKIANDQNAIADVRSKRSKKQTTN